MTDRTEVGRWVGPILAVCIAIGLGVVIYSMVRPVWEQQNITVVRGESFSKTLEATVSHGGCSSTDVQVAARETAVEVTLRARYNVRGSCNAIEILTIVTVELSEPLGTRSVVIDNPRRGTSSCVVIDDAHDRCD